MKVHLKVLFSVATDLGALWTELKELNGIHLGGEHSSYAVYYDGNQETAMRILCACMRYSKNGKFYADFDA